MSRDLVDHVTLSPCADPSPSARRSRWAFWRSPEQQPAWARPALLGIALVAAVLYAWNITSAGYAPFYAPAVKSMSESWKAFFYGAFDPQATITIDKLAGSFLPQALSARIFGFHPWSLALPQVIEGVISVLVMYRVVRRWAGARAGLLAAAIFTFTPIAASMFGHSMEDGALTMCLVLAADSWQRAVMDARLRSLIWSGVWVGLGFQAKMLQAWMILPALTLGYLISAPAPLRRRLWHLAAAGAVMLAVSVSWIALYSLTPAADRPYVDGSTNNSAFAMVFGYNGLERFGIRVPGAVASGPGVTVTTGSGSTGTGPRAGITPARTAAGPAGDASSGASVPATTAGGGGGASSLGGWAKLLGGKFGPEVGWLYPLALLTLAAGLLARRRAARADPVRAGLVMWGAWLATFGLVYSAMSNIPHTAYMASLAPPVAALSAAGVAMMWRWYRAGEGRGWLLPLAIAAEMAWAAELWSSYPGFLPWARWAALAAGVAALVALVVARLPERAHSRREARRPRYRFRTRLTAVGLAVGTGAMLAPPVTWAASVLDVRYAGSSFDASAGPAGSMGSPASTGHLARALPAGARNSGIHPVPGGAETGRDLPGGYAGGPATRGGIGGGNAGGPATRGGTSGGNAGGPATRGGTSGGNAGGAATRGGTSGGQNGILASATTTLSDAQQKIYDYVSAHRYGATYLMAVTSWSQASPYIMATGKEVLPLGGFSGSVPEPTLARIRQLVSTGQIRFFLLGSAGAGQGPGAGGGTTQRQAIASWVERSCGQVPAKDYAGSAAPATGAGTASSGSGTLYECTKA